MGFPWSQVMQQLLATTLQVLVQPFFWLVVVLVWLQYRRICLTGRSLYGWRLSPLPMTAVSLVYGLLGGIIGGALIIFCGITIDGLGFGYLWGLALALMLLNPRFLCFSYAGGLLALVSLITGYPRINIPSLLGLVAVLHLVESFLILLDGRHNPFPVYLSDHRGETVGGFSLQKFWPLPLVALTMIAGQPAGGHIDWPSWWPLLNMINSSTGSLTCLMLPVVAALGYGDLAASSLPAQKAGQTAGGLLAFSLTLLALSLLASHRPIFGWPAALFAPLGHELVIRLGRRAEFGRSPLWVAPPKGVLVLAVGRGSPAERAGLRSGDLILAVGGNPIVHDLDLDLPISQTTGGGTELLTGRGIIRVFCPRGSSLGVIPAPASYDLPNVKFDEQSPLVGLMKKMRRRIFR